MSDNPHTVADPVANLSVAATLLPSAAQANTLGNDCSLLIGNYEVLEEIGRGGMGVVYKARQVGLNRLCALKMILGGAHAGESTLDRFKVEAETIARLSHPNIVQIYDVGEHEGRAFIALELVEGGSLADKLQGAPQVPRTAAALVETLARGMQIAHDAGIVHRDLKPANILIQMDKSGQSSSGGSGTAKPASQPQSKSGSKPPSSRPSWNPDLTFGIPKITDFGLAKQLDDHSGRTQSGAIMGTPSYMAPEQAGGRTNEVGPTADVWALGAILYECLTGHPPFRAATAFDTIMLVLNSEPVSVRELQPKVPADLETICLKCLRKESAKRYTSALELADDLRRFLHGEPILARPTSQLERLLKWVWRHPALSMLLAFCALLLAGVVTGGIVSYTTLRACE